MKFYRLIVNRESPLGELEIRRTRKNFPFSEKSLATIWDRNDFMPVDLLKGEFSLTDESHYLDILKVSHLGWEGIMVNGPTLDIFIKFNLQEFRLAEINVYENNNESIKKSVPYNLIHFRSNAASWLKKICYTRTLRRSREQQHFEVTYSEFLNNEINIPIMDRILRHINITEMQYFGDVLPGGFFDVFYNTFLFKTEFIISDKLQGELSGLSGFSIEEGPQIIST
jgi:hypothetical protein